MSDKNFIVPHDFTGVADRALHHAIITAKVVNAKIYVLHVVSRSKEIKDAEKKLKAIIADYQDKGVEVIAKIRVGSIFEDIGDFAAEHHAELIFMGTHGASGWQHIAGSHALKVITHSTVPFIIVQKETISETSYNDIVVPLDLHNDTKQKLTIVASMAEYFHSEVHVITPIETDEFLKNKVNANLLFAKRFFDERKIKMTRKVAPSSGFDAEVIKYAIEIDADLISIMNQNNTNIMGAFGSNYEQFIITNEAQIPVLVVNPMETPYGKSVLFSYNDY